MYLCKPKTNEKKSMKEKELKINNILSEWNPLCVDDDVLENEYRNYIPGILESIGDSCKLKCCIEGILQAMGIDPTLEPIKADIDNICSSISSIDMEK